VLRVGQVADVLREMGREERKNRKERKKVR
jgi:hypothetical protein